MVEVIDTKTEQVPDFIFMASTMEGKLTEATMAILMKNQLVEQVGGFYKIKSGESVPFDIYMVIKNDILFIGSNESQFQSIISNRTISNSSSELMNHIRGNQMAVYAAPKKAGSLVNSPDVPKETKDILENSPDMLLTVGKMKGNISSGSFTIKTPGGYKNGMSYILSFVEELAGSN